MIKPVLTTLLFALSLSSCHESLEKRAEREAREFTEKNCPTPPQNDAITDSLVFDVVTRTHKTYLTFTGQIDNPEAIKEHEEDIRKELLNTIRQNTSMKAYKDAGFNFEYICRSEKEGKIVLHLKYSEKDYQ